MNIKVLFLGAVVVVLTVASLSAGPLLSPRAQGNQNAVAKGASNNVPPAMACQSMGGSQKSMAGCTPDTTMSCCTMGARDK